MNSASAFRPSLHIFRRIWRCLAKWRDGAPWMVAGLGVDIRPFIAIAVERGGHIRVGLEYLPWGVDETNRGLVE